jgi:hypothetical protein
MPIVAGHGELEFPEFGDSGAAKEVVAVAGWSMLAPEGWIVAEEDESCSESGVLTYLIGPPSAAGRPEGNCAPRLGGIAAKLSVRTNPPPDEAKETTPTTAVESSADAAPRVIAGRAPDGYWHRLEIVGADGDSELLARFATPPRDNDRATCSAEQLLETRGDPPGGPPLPAFLPGCPPGFSPISILGSKQSASFKFVDSSNRIRQRWVTVCTSTGDVASCAGKDAGPAGPGEQREPALVECDSPEICRVGRVVADGGPLLDVVVHVNGGLLTLDEVEDFVRLTVA